MIQFFKSFIFIGILLLSTTFGYAQTSLSLEDCVNIALKNNPMIHRAELQYQREKINKRQALQDALPYVDANIGHSWSTGKSIDPTTNQFIEHTISSGNSSVSAGLILFDGFRIFHNIRKTAAAQKAGDLQYASEKENLILDVIEAYITVLTSQDLFHQAQNQMNLSREQFEHAAILHQEGNIDPGDYYDLKGAYNESKNLVESAEQSLYHSRVKLSGLLHLSENDLSVLKPIAYTQTQPGSAPANIFELGKNRPFFSLWEWRIKEAKQNIKIARSGYYPTLSIGAGLDTRYSNSSTESFWHQNRDNLGRSISLNLSIPIFNRFQVRNSIKRAEIDLKDIQWQREMVKNELREATSKAVFDLASAEKSLRNLEEQEIDYRESFRIAQVKFDNGTSNSVLYLTAKTKWENVKNRLIIKRYEWTLQKYLNDYYGGKLEFL